MKLSNLTNRFRAAPRAVKFAVAAGVIICLGILSAGVIRLLG